MNTDASNQSLPRIGQQPHCYRQKNIHIRRQRDCHRRTLLTMSKTLPLLHGEITLESALDDDDNILPALAYPHQRFEYFVHLWKHRSEIEAIVSYHLGLNTPRETCQIAEVKDWMAGSFNVCIPVRVKKAKPCSSSRRVMVRLPLPYKVGELQHPGNAEEKIRSEAATFIWIQENCPTVPTPYLWGFGFPDGESVCGQE